MKITHHTETSPHTTPIATEHQAKHTTTTQPGIGGTLAETSKQHHQPDVPESFSLQSYLNILQGSCHTVQDRVGLWANQLLEHGVLQTQDLPSPKRHTPNLEPGRRSYPLTSTPTDPARLPAQDLDTIWDKFGEL